VPKPKKKDTAANLGFEAKLWQMADGLRNNMDAAEYKHVVLGLIFLKYISDAFEEQHAANPPFNVSDWRGELLKNDKRWKYGVPPAGNAITSGLIPA
jgi:type I restriction-modification system DNA methylase subunit